MFAHMIHQKFFFAEGIIVYSYDRWYATDLKNFFEFKKKIIHYSEIKINFRDNIIFTYKVNTSYIFEEIDLFFDWNEHHLNKYISFICFIEKCVNLKKKNKISFIHFDVPSQNNDYGVTFIYGIKISHFDNKLILEYAINFISLIPYISEYKIHLLTQNNLFLYFNFNSTSMLSKDFAETIFKKNCSYNRLELVFEKNIFSCSNVILYTRDKNTYGDENLYKILENKNK